MRLPDSSSSSSSPELWEPPWPPALAGSPACDPGHTRSKGGCLLDLSTLMWTITAPLLRSPCVAPGDPVTFLQERFVDPTPHRSVKDKQESTPRAIFFSKLHRLSRKTKGVAQGQAPGLQHRGQTLFAGWELSIFATSIVWGGRELRFKGTNTARPKELWEVRGDGLHSTGSPHTSRNQRTASWNLKGTQSRDGWAPCPGC